MHPTLGYVYVATANGFYLSINGGASFTKEVTGSVLGLDVISTYPNNVYINESDGVYFSTNWGKKFYEDGEHQPADNAFVAALVLWAILFYASRPTISHSDQGEGCAMNHGASAHCAEPAPQRRN